MISTQLWGERKQLEVFGTLFLILGTLATGIAIYRGLWANPHPSFPYLEVEASVGVVLLGLCVSWLLWPVYRVRLDGAEFVNATHAPEGGLTLTTGVVIASGIAFAIVWLLLILTGVVPAVTEMTLVCLGMGTSFVGTARRIRKMERQLNVVYFRVPGHGLLEGLPTRPRAYETRDLRSNRMNLPNPS